MSEAQRNELDAPGCSRFYVWHPEGADLGLIAPCFSTYAEARAKADEWNKEVEGHNVLEITEANMEDGEVALQLD